ncbi:unnamed protein product [Schistosoma turkestanicum]|nr:unnamed protein product [Schistosoma turkestanicum]
MGTSKVCLTNCLNASASEKVLFVISLCTILLGFVLIFTGVCVTQLNGGLSAHLSISYSAIPVVFAGFIALLIAIFRIVSTRRILREMDLTVCDFRKQWNEKESGLEPISNNLQGNAYNSFSVVNNSLSNLNSNSFSNNKVEHLPVPITNCHQRLPMPPRRAVLY